MLTTCNGPKKDLGVEKVHINIQGQVFTKHTLKAFPLSTRSEISWFCIKKGNQQKPTDF